MTTTEKNGARDEYFDQLITNASMWIGAFNNNREDDMTKYKDRILGVTYDPHVALQKRVEELEAALKEYVEFHERIQSLGFINRVVGAPIKNTASKLLTK